MRLRKTVELSQALDVRTLFGSIEKRNTMLALRCRRAYLQGRIDVLERMGEDATGAREQLRQLQLGR